MSPNKSFRGIQKYKMRGCLSVFVIFVLILTIVIYEENRHLPPKRRLVDAQPPAKKPPSSRKPPQPLYNSSNVSVIRRAVIAAIFSAAACLASAFAAHIFRGYGFHVGFLWSAAAFGIALIPAIVIVPFWAIAGIIAIFRRLVHRA